MNQKKILGCLGVICALALVSCQGRPKTLVQVKQNNPNENTQSKPQNIKAISLLAADRLLQSAKLLKLMISAIGGQEKPAECEVWKVDNNVLTFRKCVSANVYSAGIATVELDSTSKAFKSFKFENKLDETVSATNKTVKSSTKILLSATNIQFESETSGLQTYRANLQFDDLGMDGKDARDIQIDAPNAKLMFSGTTLKSVKFGANVTAKLQRKFSGVDKTLTIHSDDYLTYADDQGFWKGSFEAQTSEEVGAKNDEIAVNEGVIGLTNEKNKDSLSVICNKDRKTELMCLLSRVHQTGPGMN